MNDEVPPTDGQDLRIAVERAEQLIKDKDVFAARRAVEEALARWADHRILLSALADVEFAEGDLEAGRLRLAELVNANASDAMALSRQIRGLDRNGLVRDALLAVEATPAALCENPAVRMAMGLFYRRCGCWSHAVKGFGQARNLPRHARSQRRWCWLLTGGPISWIRTRAYSWEESKLLSELRRQSSS